MERYQKIFNEQNEITVEMINWFFERTNMHINYVKLFGNKIIENDELRKYIDVDSFKNDIINHDQSKFQEPELIPYIKLSWRHKFDNYKSYKKPGTIEDEEINNATVHHIKNNKHHPEFWNNSIQNLINKDDRNKSSGYIVDATKMPMTYIASMVADWMAMSHELEDNPNDWAKKNINVRWKFCKDQTDFIYKIINETWI
jgi:hypothetical protein